MIITKDMGRIAVQYFSPQERRLLTESRGTTYGTPVSKQNIFEIHNENVGNLVRKLVSLIINLDLTRDWQRHVTPEQLISINETIKNTCMNELIEAEIITKRTKDIIIHNMYYDRYSNQNKYIIILFSVSGKKLLDVELVTFFRY